MALSTKLLKALSISSGTPLSVKFSAISHSMRCCLTAAFLAKVCSSFPHSALMEIDVICGDLCPSNFANNSKSPTRLSMRSHCCCRSEEHTSELQSRPHLVCRLLLEK